MAVELQDAACADYVIAGRPMLVDEMLVRVPGGNLSVALRTNTSDFATFRQIFVDYDYFFEHPSPPNTIIDLGCNVGLASVYYGIRYPGARILGIEPDPDNVRMAVKNTAALGTRCRIRQGAAWYRDGEIDLHVKRNGYEIEAWGRHVSEGPSHDSAPQDTISVPAFSMRSILEMAEFETVDILKIDIEGAEVELFSGNGDWMGRVRTIIIETHDRFRSESETLVRHALSGKFEQVHVAGENIYFKNRHND